MNRRRSQILIVIVLTSWCGGLTACDSSVEPVDTNVRNSEQPGLRVYVNPDTGEFEEPPAEQDETQEVSAQRQGVARQSDLEEIEGLGPDYGVGIRLNGQFQSNINAAVVQDGIVETNCQQHLAPTNERPK